MVVLLVFDYTKAGHTMHARLWATVGFPLMAFLAVPLVTFVYKHDLIDLAERFGAWDVERKVLCIESVQRTRSTYHDDAILSPERGAFLNDTKKTASAFVNASNCWRLRSFHIYFLGSVAEGVLCNLARLLKICLVVLMAFEVIEGNVSVGMFVLMYSLYEDLLKVATQMMGNVHKSMNGYPALVKIAALLNQPEDLDGTTNEAAEDKTKAPASVGVDSEINQPRSGRGPTYKPETTRNKTLE